MAALPAPLSKTGKRMLAEAEARIEAGLATFMEVGQALVTIRDGRLYREDHGTFEDYCRDRWGFTGRRARQLIDAAEIGTTVPVANEGQARALAGLPPEQASEVYEATKAAGPVTAASLTATRRQATKTETVNVDELAGEILSTTVESEAPSGSDQSAPVPTDSTATPTGAEDAAGPGDDQQGQSDPAASPAPKVAPIDPTLGYRATASRFKAQVRSSLLTLDPERVIETSDDHKAWADLAADLHAFADRIDQALAGPKLKAVK